MAKSLVIVESPAKAKTIEKFLGKKYTVRASKGHVRDLPKSQFGVDIENHFLPKYITIRGKGDILKELREASKKADKVYLATDPDREGEAISWHLAQTLNIDPNSPCRIVFNEITKDAVQKAITAPRPIDLKLVDAQQARRVLDRVVGYKLSPLLWRKIRRGLSAGRVQSVAVRLIVDREEAIMAFQPEEYWTLEAEVVAADMAPFRAKLVSKRDPGLSSTEMAAQLATVVAPSTGVVVDVSCKERLRNAPLPFTTSTLQQEASRKLGYAVRKTMSVAQVLYEGLEVPSLGQTGLLTYIRTDSTRVAEEAKAQAQQFILQTFGTDYVQITERKSVPAKGAQDAHEAIRPAHPELTPDSIKSALSNDQYKLYRLIWERFMASQMSKARYEATTIQLNFDGVMFRISGSKLLFPGYLAVLGESGASEEEELAGVPNLVRGQTVMLTELFPEQHFTQPPSRFNDASLVHELETLGIGRPSTYAPTIDTIATRGYVEKVERRFHPTELGRMVVALLKEYFPEIVDPTFTAELESELDQVEEGKERWIEVMDQFYEGFAGELNVAEEAIGGLEIKEEETDVLCDTCGRNMIVKYGRFGKFLACPNFPECKGTKPYLERTGARCPLCQGEVVQRKTKKGRSFYGCEHYPDCTFSTWLRPVRGECPHCGKFLVERRSKKEGTQWVCVDENCDYEQTPDAEEA